MKWTLFFTSLVPVVERFVREKSHVYHIDYSHNIHHSWRVVELASFIANREYHWNNAQQEVLYLSSMLHDMCDPKYTPWAQSVLDVSNFLQKQCYTSMMVHDGVMNIITSMSYSQVVQPNGSLRFPPWLLKEKNFKEVYHTVREADLLTSYDLKRMVHYKHDKLGLLYSTDIYQDIVHTTNSRMCRLLDKKDMFISLTAKRVAKEWHKELCDEVMPFLTPDDIYPILHQPIETMDQFRQKLKIF